MFKNPGQVSSYGERVAKRDDEDSRQEGSNQVVASPHHVNKGRAGGRTASRRRSGLKVLLGGVKLEVASVSRVRGWSPWRLPKRTF